MFAISPRAGRDKKAPGRLFDRWWGQQSASRQDRFATLGPLVSVMLFLAAIISSFWYLRNEEFERETESIRRDTEVAQQEIRLRLMDNQEQLMRLAREIMLHPPSPAEFTNQVTRLVHDRPEITRLLWLNADRSPRAAFSVPGVYADPVSDDENGQSVPRKGQVSAAERAFMAARDRRQPVLSAPFNDMEGLPVVQLHVPLSERGGFNGVLVADYSLETLVRFRIPAELSKRHTISLIDAQDQVLASTVARQPGQRARPAPVVHVVPVMPSDDTLFLRGQGYRTSIGLIGNTLFWMVVALSVLTGWMLLGTWRHMRGRSQMQSALATEANFRRAMENSMLTGMRAMDMEGRITYVNPAFCAMTGFEEHEIVDILPPFPYWPTTRHEENSRLFQQELEGRSPAGGIEIKVMRKDGSLFDSRMYVSPLIDSKGQQTGWMTSMTNITEAKRIRDQLSASHERFTTVLESLDAAVSVLSVQQGELLFANRSYRVWFGADALGHAMLSGDDSPFTGPVSGFDDAVESMGGLPTQAITEAGSDSHEVFVDTLAKWFDVRSRYLQWTDGRLAQMLIATDVTVRRNAEAVAASQAEQAQVTSRLVTMGEMASSVAHELNQPLTAIANYCSGMVSRIRDNAIERDDLVAALEKTSRQAQRAGQIIHRIRAFVKRSEPQRVEADARVIVEDALELASIELRRRKIAIKTYIAQRLPVLKVDPILIEQVVLNLIKNAAEAIDGANLPTARRNIELRVLPQHSSEEGEVIEFSVTDTGPGIKNEVITRLYEAFFSTKAEGMGIGLSLCRSIIESHRGRIKAQNLYNADAVIGCRFSFTLPVEISPHEVPNPLNPALTS